MAGKTIRKAAVSLAASFRNRIGRSSLHQGHKKDSEFWNDLRLLFRAMENTSPNTKQQKAVTPQLLRAMVHSSSEDVINDPEDHATDLIVGGYFFAMRSCEFAKAAKEGRTKMIRLGGIKFYNKKHREINHRDPRLIQKARFVWILFEEQKNLEKNKSRTQKASGDINLCGVRVFACVV